MNTVLKDDAAGGGFRAGRVQRLTSAVVAILTAVLASLAPARRAASVPPMVAMRSLMRTFTSLFDAVMERRSRHILEQVSEWLPSEGPVLDLGSGTGHVSARLERELGLEVVTADVSDIHVVGPPPVLIADGVLPFEEGTFSAALLFFMLAYPHQPTGVLAEAARVTRGPVIVVQSLHSGRVGYAWLRVREFLWTVVAFRVSKLLGYVPREAKFAMRTRRFYTASELQRDVTAAGLRIRARGERPVLPGRSLTVAAWMLDRDE